MTALSSLSGAPEGFYRSEGGDLWMVDRAAKPRILTVGLQMRSRVETPTIFDGDHVKHGPFAPVEIVDKPAPPLPETPGSLVEHEGKTYVLVGGAPFPREPWRSTAGPAWKTPRSLLGATVLFDAATLSTSTAKDLSA